MVREEAGRLRLRPGAYAFYVVSFAVVVVCTVVGIAYGQLGEAVVGIPMIIILGYTIFLDRKVIHVPPEMVLLVVLAFILSFLSHIALDDNSALMVAANLLTGVNLGLLGLILVYIVIRSLPEYRTEGRASIAFVAVCVAVAIYSMTRLLQYFLIEAVPTDQVMRLDQLMDEMVTILAGSAVVGLIHVCSRRDNLFGGILNSFLEENSDLIGMEDREREDILRIIEDGESEWTEFKSTLRVNLNTGEPDKRMERAVLKTIVAFLNSDGGNLLIGVADDGTVIGADVDSFENKDKMGLHLGNIISAQIGSGFLPFISTHMVEFDGGRVVIRVRCSPSDKPVFLKEGKVETFFVRKGPQSEELTGMTLLNYVSNRWRSGHAIRGRDRRPRKSISTPSQYALAPRSAASLGTALTHPLPGMAIYARSFPTSRKTVSQECVSTPLNLLKSPSPSVLTIHNLRSPAPCERQDSKRSGSTSLPNASSKDPLPRSRNPVASSSARR